MNYAKRTHDCLVGAIRAMTPTDNSRKPGTHFTRKRKFPFEDVILHLISSGRGNINEEVRKYSIANVCQTLLYSNTEVFCYFGNRYCLFRSPRLWRWLNG